MKIAYITSFFPPDRMAGAELGMHFMAQFMASKGYEVHVLITRPNEARPNEERDGYTIHWLNPPKLKGLKFFQESSRALACLERIQPDLIHANCLLPGASIAVQYAKKHPLVKTLVLCYGYDVSDMSFPISIWGKRGLRRVSQALAATEYCKEIMQSWVPELNPLVYLAGCDTKVFPLLPLKPKGETYDLLFIGRMIPEKGLDYLFKIFQKLPETYRLKILGGGDRLEYYQGLATRFNGRVQFLGQVPNHECSQYLADSHALVLPSFREPFGVVCIEAVVSGLPVVASDVMGIPEAVVDQVNGRVVQGRDHEDWVSAIRACCEDEAFREKIHQSAGEFRAKWEWEQRLEELEKIYETLA